MATYQDFNLIKKEVNFISGEESINTHSRAFIKLFFEKLLPQVESEDYITDGPNDLGIDAYYIDSEENKIILFQFKYAETFNAATSNTVSPRELTNIFTTIKSIWNRDDSFLKSSNSRIHEALSEIFEALEKGDALAELKIITNYQKPIDQAQKKRFEDLFKTEFGIGLQFYSLADIISLVISARRSPLDLEIKLYGNKYFEESTGDIRALVGEINAWELLNSLIDESNKDLKVDLFDENVRIYLKTKGRVNKQIYDTAISDKSYKFFFYNNGITAICDAFSYTPNYSSPPVKVKNFQIVNGGQTIHALFDAYNKSAYQDKIKEIYLLIRIYEVKERSLGQEIAQYTNTQNPIKSRDLRSNDSIQIKIEEELRTLKYYYERKKNQYRDSGKPVDSKIDAEKAGQTILAFHLEKPGSAKNKKQEIFGDFYYSIFDEDKVDSEYVLIPYKLFKEIDRKIKLISREIRRAEELGETKNLKKILERKEFMLHAHYYILLTIKLLAQREGKKVTLKNTRSIFNKYFKVADELIYKVIKKKRKDPKFSLPKIFKGDDLVEEIKEMLQQFHKKVAKPLIK